MNTQITDSGHARAWIEISRGALAANAAFLKSRLPEHCRLMPAVKAEAYGHGAVPVARELSKAGVDAFCVACVQEGVALREAGIEGEILVLGYTHPEEFYLLEKYRISQTVVDREYARLLSRYGRKLHVHVGIDTGMRRLGERSDEISGIMRLLRRYLEEAWCLTGYSPTFPRTTGLPPRISSSLCVRHVNSILLFPQ